MARPVVRHLRAALTEYQAHYNTARPHKGIAQRVPGGERDPRRIAAAGLDSERNPPKIRPQRPDQRIRASRPRLRQTAGHQLFIGAGTASTGHPIHGDMSEISGPRSAPGPGSPFRQVGAWRLGEIQVRAFADGQRHQVRVQLPGSDRSGQHDAGPRIGERDHVCGEVPGSGQCRAKTSLGARPPAQRGTCLTGWSLFEIFFDRLGFRRPRPAGCWPA
jgi:hypothetical protein